MTLDSKRTVKGAVIFVCDGCDKMLSANTRYGWASALKTLHREHWKAYKEDGKWNHYCCSDCVVVGDAVRRFKMIVGRPKSAAV
jgi:hypothetical protein